MQRCSESVTLHSQTSWFKPSYLHLPNIWQAISTCCETLSRIAVLLPLDKGESIRNEKKLLVFYAFQGQV